MRKWTATRTILLVFMLAMATVSTTSVGVARSSFSEFDPCSGYDPRCQQTGEYVDYNRGVIVCTYTCDYVYTFTCDCGSI